MPKAPTTHNRVRLTTAQKRAFLDLYDANPSLLQEEVCALAASQFRLPQPPATSTLRLLLKSADVIRGGRQPPSQKTNRAVACEQLEEELVRWIGVYERLRLPVVSGAAIQSKAEQIRERILRDKPSGTWSKLEAMKFSNGWLDKLKRRYGIKVRVLHGEATSTSAATIATGRATLREVTRPYKKQDIFNLDETAYFYCSAPTRTHSKDSFPGTKQSKKRITIAVTSNADGSAKVPLLFVGTARQPRCFSGASASDLGVQYRHSAKEWMTSELFKQWLRKFNDAMRDEQRQVILLLDNASCHRVNTELSNVKVHMLPPNTTAHLQPQDSGVIRAIKARIIAIKNRHVVEKLDSIMQREDEIDSEEIAGLVKELYEVDILVAMRWAQEAWESVTSETIVNCWRHTEILDEESYELEDSMQRLRLSPN